MHRTHALLLAAATLLLAAATGAQDHPNLARGFSADQAYDRTGLDSVNLWNGNLTLAIPIGQRYRSGGNVSWGLTLYYNSNVWDYQEQDFWHPHDGGSCAEYDGIPTVSLTVAKPVTSNAGLGWDLSLGALDGPYGSTDASPNWVYTSPDGAKHAFYSTLHPGETATQRTTDTRSGWHCGSDGNPACDVFYTRDNTHLRLIALIGSDGFVQGGDVESPEGTVERFSTVSGTATGRLEKVIDVWNNTLTVSYTTLRA